MLHHRLLLHMLRRELPGWVQRGWVTPAGEEAILADVTARAGFGPHALPRALYALGVALLGAGIFSYVAANWPHLAKAGKVAVLLGGLWACYGLGLWLERRQWTPRLVEALKVLGVLVFGANVQLIAQIFHISAHYPNGVLMWALGGLLTAWALRSQAALVVTVALGLMWSEMEKWGFEAPFHWPFLLFWTACALPALRYRWTVALEVLAAVLVLWLNTTLLGGRIRQVMDSPVYAAQLLLWANGALYVAGRLLARHAGAAPLAGLARYALLGGLLCLLVLSSPNAQKVGFSWGHREPAEPWAWAVQCAALAAFVVLLVGWVLLTRRGGRGAAPGASPPVLPGWTLPGLGLGLALAVLLTANLGVDGDDWGGRVAAGVNVLVFALLAWSSYAGYRLASPFLVNAAFGAFALLLLIRYLESFWTLLSRAYFFMAGGLLLVGAGWWLEHTRRRLLGRMAEGRGDTLPAGEDGP